MLQRLGIAAAAARPEQQERRGGDGHGQAAALRQDGHTLDVTLSSLGDSSTLQGGTLLLTPLQGPDGRVYALAQGPISVGGVLPRAERETACRRTIRRWDGFPEGAVVEREVPAALDPAASRAPLLQADFTTAVRLAEAVNGAGLGLVARATIRRRSPCRCRRPSRVG